MNVGFLHIGTEFTLPTIMVQSVRRHLPGACVVQMTDTATPVVPGVDVLRRAEYDDAHLMTFRMDHLAALPPGQWLILDTDVIVQRDVTYVFHEMWLRGAALTRRYGTIIGPGGVNLVESMPYNTGVMFVTDPEFFRVAAIACQQLPEAKRRWWGDQLAVKQVVDSGYRVIDLPCTIYNHSPDSEDEDVSARAIVHFKGPRKEWMPQFWERSNRQGERDAHARSGT